MIYRRSFYVEACKNIALLMLVLSGLATMILMARLITSNSQLQAESVITLLALQLLKYSPNLLSASCFAGLVVTFNRMAQSHELAAWANAGLRTSHWVYTASAMSIPMALTVLFLSLYTAPWSVRYSADYQKNLANALQIEDSTPGIFGEMSQQGMVYHLSALSHNRSQALGVFIANSTSADSFQIVSADSAKTTLNNSDLRQIVLNQGSINFVDFETRTANKISFTEANFHLENENKNKTTQLSPRSKKLSNLNTTPSNQTEYYWRFTLAVALVLFGLLALQLGRASPGSGRGYQVLIALLAFWFFSAISGFFKDIGSNGKIAPILASILPLLILAVATFALSFARSLWRKE